MTGRGNGLFTHVARRSGAMALRCSSLTPGTWPQVPGVTNSESGHTISPTWFKYTLGLFRCHSRYHRRIRVHNTATRASQRLASGPAAKRFFNECLELADGERNVDLYHWSSAKFSSTWYDTFCVSVAKGRAQVGVAASSGDWSKRITAPHDGVWF